MQHLSKNWDWAFAISTSVVCGADGRTDDDDEEWGVMMMTMSGVVRWWWRRRWLTIIVASHKRIKTKQLTRQNEKNLQTPLQQQQQQQLQLKRVEGVVRPATNLEEEEEEEEERESR